MGNYLDLPANVSLSEQQRDINDLLFAYKGKLGGSSFLRTFHYLHGEHGAVVMKVYTIRPTKDRDPAARGRPTAIIEARNRLVSLNRALRSMPFPHVCLYQALEIRSSIAFMVRPYIHTTMRERLLLRPFLTHIEKLWLIYQLLQAVDGIHSCGVCHGDIKTENVLVTSWNWLLLADFAPYKPVYMNIEKTVDFAYYFDTGGRRRCSVAPERFQKSDSLNLGLGSVELKPSMDVFAVGCTIAEILIHESLFQYADVIAYQREETLPAYTVAQLDKVHAVDPKLHVLVTQMITREPSSRPSTRECLQRWHADIFPPLFRPLHALVAPLMRWRRDHRVLHLKRVLWPVLDGIQGRFAAKAGLAPHASCPRDATAHRSGGLDAADGAVASVPAESTAGLAADSDVSGAAPVDSTAAACSASAQLESAAQTSAGGLCEDTGGKAAAKSSARSDAVDESAESGRSRVESGDVGSTARTENEAEYCEGAGEAGAQSQNGSEPALGYDVVGRDRGPGTSMLTQADMPRPRVNFGCGDPLVEELCALTIDSDSETAVLTIFAGLLFMALRGAVTQEARYEALRMLFVLGVACDEECKLQHIVPYLLSYVVDHSTPSTRAAAAADGDTLPRALALRHIDTVLRSLPALPRAERGLFVEYLLPALSGLPQRGEELKREYTRVMPVLACTALALHDAALQAALQDDAQVTLQQCADSNSQQLQVQSTEVARLRQDMQVVAQNYFLPEKHGDMWVHLMQHAGSLAAFFGPQVTNSVFVPSMLWLPNDSNWRVRAAFCEHLADIAGYVGSFTLNKVFLPVLDATLHNPGEKPDVLVHALRSIRSLVAASLLSAQNLFCIHATVARSALRLLTHYATAVRAAALALLAELACALDLPDVYALLCPALQLALGSDRPLDVNPLLLSEPAVVADAIRHQHAMRRTPDPTFPRSRADSARQVIASGGYRAPPSSTPRLAAEALSPLIYPSHSLHTLALRQAQLQCPQLPCRATFSLQNGDVSRQSSAQASSSAFGQQLNSEAAAPADATLDAAAREPSALRESDIRQASSCKRAPGCKWHLQCGDVVGPVIADAVPQTAQAELTARLLRSSVMRSGADGTLDIGDARGDLPGAGDLASGARSAQDLSDFRPRGVLMAHMAEHQHTVNSLCVSQDANNWLASASSDGTVKLWGCARDGVQLDKIGTFSSMLTYGAHEGRVIDAQIINDDASDKLSVASLDSTGVLHLWDAAVQPRKAPNQRTTLSYTAQSPLESHLEAGRALRLRQWGPLLLVLTELGGVHAFDPRASRCAWRMQAPRQDGVCLSLAVVPDCPALCTATNRGMLHLWDVRFQICVDSWWHERREAIHALACPGAAPSVLGVRSYAGPAPLLYVAAGGNEVSLYDLDKCRRRQAIRLWQGGSAPVGTSPGDSMLSTARRDNACSAEFPDSVQQGMRALLPLPSGGLLCAGTDKCIRYVHAKEASGSYLVCGPLCGGYYRSSPEHGPSMRPDVQYQHRMEGDVGVLLEDIVNEARPAVGANAADKAYRRLQAQCHRDCITELAVANLATGPLLLSASRDGVIKAWR